MWYQKLWIFLGITVMYGQLFIVFYISYPMLIVCCSLVFRRKGLCKAKQETQSVFKFSDVFLHLSQMELPGRVILWPRVVLTWAQLTWAQMYPLVEASSGHEWYYIRSAWHLVNLWVRLTFGQMYPLVAASTGQEWYLFGFSWPELRCPSF